MSDGLAWGHHEWPGRVRRAGAGGHAGADHRHPGDEDVKSDLLDVIVKLLGETEKAVKVTNEENEEVWIPKSQVEIEHRLNGYVQITMPEWLASAKGFT